MRPTANRWAASLRRKLTRWVVLRNRPKSEAALGPFALRRGERAETLALVTLLGQDGDTAARMVESARQKIRHFDRLVFVLTCDDLAAATRHGAVVEQLPGARETLAGKPDATAQYLQSRYDQILQRWAPDYVFQYGASLEGYISAVLEVHLENSELPF
jgi:hypothetical protein